MSVKAIVGHFHGDDVVCDRCCPFDACKVPESQWPFYPSDVAAGYAAGQCTACRRPVCEVDPRPLVPVDYEEPF